jgi:hypothetical protein
LLLFFVVVFFHLTTCFLSKMLFDSIRWWQGQMNSLNYNNKLLCRKC